MVKQRAAAGWLIEAAGLFEGLEMGNRRPRPKQEKIVIVIETI